MKYIQNKWSKITGLLFRGASVQRCHTCTLTRPRTVAEHSFRVMLLYWQLAANGGAFNPRVMETILLHDLAECVTGDIPAQVKKMLTKDYPNSISCLEEHFLRTVGHPHIDEYWSLTPFDTAVVRVLDTLELLIMCWEERMLYGNQSVQDMHRRVWVYFVEKHNALIEVCPADDEFRALVDRISVLAQTFICPVSSEGEYGSTTGMYHE